MSTNLGTTNETLTDPQRSHVRQLLNDTRLQRDTIDAEIRRTQERLTALYKQRRPYPAYTRRLQTALAPHKDLPPEVLSEIFWNCFDDYGDGTVVPVSRFRRRPSLPVPWALGQVCSRWRQVVLNDSRFWAGIHLRGYNSCTVSMLQEAFKRSGRSPLRLDACGYQENGCNYFVRDVVCPQVHRITHLRLQVPSEIFYDFLCLPPGLLNALENVYVETFVDSDTAALQGVPDPSVFRRSFRLQRVEINVPLEIIPPTFLLLLGLSWRTLTHIEFMSIPIQLSIALAAVAQCTSLRECSLTLTNDVFLQASPADSIRLFHLRKLAIQEYQPNPDLLPEFLRPLVLPALEDFAFSLSERTSLGDLAPLAELAGIVDSWSRGPALRAELHYWGKHLAEVVGPLSFLTSIDAGCSALPASGIRMMAQEQYLPRLSSLRTSVACADMDGFIEMLKTRWERAVGREGVQRQTGAIRSGRIFVVGADYEVISGLSRKIREVQEEMGMLDAKIDLSLGVLDI